MDFNLEPVQQIRKETSRNKRIIIKNKIHEAVSEGLSYVNINEDKIDDDIKNELIELGYEIFAYEAIPATSYYKIKW